MGVIWEAGEERVDGRHSKRAGKERNWGNYTTLHNISQSKKGKRMEAKKKGVGAGIAAPPRHLNKDNTI